MHYFILGVLCLILVVLMARWAVSASSSPQAGTMARRFGGPLAFLLAIIFALMGRLGLALPLVGLGLWLATQSKRAQGQRTQATTSQVETAWLDMVLDHDSGHLDGVVKQGRLRGERLTDLTFDDLMELHTACAQGEPQSAQILEAFLDRQFPDWRNAAGGGANHGSTGANASGVDSSGPMTLERAYEILGLAPGATEEDIRRAHRTLMMKVHPDRGGSPFLAAQINAAKDLLLGR